MKSPSPRCNWFFVDESGDPTFYDRSGNLIVGVGGCSKLLILGFIETADPEPMRASLRILQTQLITDPYFADVPSLKKTGVAFHAKDDLPEIRYEVFKLLAQFNFKAQFVVARKIESVFRNEFQAQENRFYDHLVAQLFQNCLHRSTENRIYFAKRGSRQRQAPLAAAIRHGIGRFEAKWNTSVTTTYTVQAQSPSGEPCLSICDYLNWAVQRGYTRGEMRYYKYVEDKVSLIADIYDGAKYPKNWYNRRNPFHISKITPL